MGNLPWKYGAFLRGRLAALRASRPHSKEPRSWHRTPRPGTGEEPVFPCSHPPLSAIGCRTCNLFVFFASYASSRSTVRWFTKPAPLEPSAGQGFAVGHNGRSRESVSAIARLQRALACSSGWPPRRQPRSSRRLFPPVARRRRGNAERLWVALACDRRYAAVELVCAHPRGEGELIAPHDCGSHVSEPAPRSGSLQPGSPRAPTARLALEYKGSRTPRPDRRLERRCRGTSRRVRRNARLTFFFRGYRRSTTVVALRGAGGCAPFSLPLPVARPLPVVAGCHSRVAQGWLCRGRLRTCRPHLLRARRPKVRFAKNDGRISCMWCPRTVSSAPAECAEATGTAHHPAYRGKKRLA